MATKPILLLAAVATAGLGALALVTGSGPVAAVAGLAAIVVASLALNHAGSGAAPAPGADPDGDVAVEADLHLAGLTRASVGMLDESALLTALRSRAEVARRTHRPLSVIHLDVLEITEDGRTRSGRDLHDALLDSTLRDSDLCGRRRDGVYVFILEDTGEDGAVWTAERLRRRLVAEGGERRYCAGIASFPDHALDATALDAKAAAALEAAKEWQQDRIEVATVS